MALLLSALFTACLLSPLGGMVAQAAPADPALACNPAFAAVARQHPMDWEQRTDPSIKPLIGWQRLVGCHAQLVGLADEAPNPSYPHPRVVVDVAHWDKSDLFALGLPRVYDHKPVVIYDTGAGFQAAGGTAGGDLGMAAGGQGEAPARVPAVGMGGAGGSPRLGGSAIAALSLGLLGVGALVGALGWRRATNRRA